MKNGGEGESKRQGDSFESLTQDRETVGEKSVRFKWESLQIASEHFMGGSCALIRMSIACDLDASLTQCKSSDFPWLFGILYEI
jgi:hypothetical protein